MTQVEEILGSIEIGPEVLEALVADRGALHEEKRAGLQAMRKGLLLRIAEAGRDELNSITQVRDAASRASSARITFQGADEADRLEVLSSVLCYLGVEDGRIASYQRKGPFGFLEKDASGAFIHQWWAIEDLNL